MTNDAGSIVSNLQFRPLSQADALDMVSWRYPWPYSVYDLNAQDSGVLAELLRPENRYHAILRDGEMAGFFCLGPEARVPGWSYDHSALDLGMGLRPDWTGQGRGHGCLMSVLSFVERTSPAVVFRATVAAWNQRAIRVCRRAGFQTVAAFKKQSEASQDFIVLLRSVPSQTRSNRFVEVVQKEPSYEDI